MPKPKPSPNARKSSSSGKPEDKRSSSSGSHSQAGVDPIALLERDHREVERFFADFEGASGNAQKRKIANAICVALKVHARLEEELFYPAAATVLGNPNLIQEAIVEHATAKDLIAQIETGAPGEAYYDARVRVLAEYIQHHVAEEEGEIFPQVRSSDLDLDALGRQIATRKLEMMLGFVVSNPVLGLI
jgi:hemerythrin superfamily protein